MRLRAIQRVLGTYKKLVTVFMSPEEHAGEDAEFVKVIEVAITTTDLEVAEDGLQSVIDLLNSMKPGTGDVVAATVMSEEARLMTGGM